MIKIAILGFGKVGQTILETVQQKTNFKKRFEVLALWNRTTQVFNQFDIPGKIKVYKSMPNLVQNLNEIDLVVECAHPEVVKQYALDILNKTDLFVSSPTAFANHNFRQKFMVQMEKNQHHCYLPLGASAGVWDVIRLDQKNQIKNLTVTMKKEPRSFKIKEPSILTKIEAAKQSEKLVVLSKGSIEKINAIAPQNTNTMSVYALAAASLGFEKCTGQIIADRNLNAHIVELVVETNGGLKLSLTRDNPSNPGQVTGSATFGSFLNSLYHYQQGIKHHYFTFC